MTFFSRCEASQLFEPALRSASPRRTRTSSGDGALQALRDFLEDVGILARYALGLDYYGRDSVGLNR
ncbi:hypothetical protein [Lichenibacterium dinghuense]|uniref:hypothetical protein n=1 Tax=Lichenibacterium dinghuense TaxID=2895977 RepID=UPI001F19E090|nr:hypothetical protein [Lichenibacterium sp. 6Y81]